MDGPGFFLEFHDLTDNTGPEVWNGLSLAPAQPWHAIFVARGRAQVYAGEAGPMPVDEHQLLVFRPEGAPRLVPALAGRGTAFVHAWGSATDLVPDELVDRLTVRGAWAITRAAVREQLVELGMAPGAAQKRSVRLAWAALLWSLDEGAGPRGQNLAEAEELVRGTLDWMAQRLSRPVRLVEAAEAARVSADTLRQAFLRVLGDSPIHCHQALRHREARRLLANPRLSVKEISWRLGFPDPYGFSRSFRLHVGLSPRDYRRRQAEGKLAPGRSDGVAFDELRMHGDPPAQPGVSPLDLVE
jgi:AraC-like DNA-binding protein